MLVNDVCFIFYYKVTYLLVYICMKIEEFYIYVYDNRRILQSFLSYYWWVKKANYIISLNINVYKNKFALTIIYIYNLYIFFNSLPLLKKIHKLH